MSALASKSDNTGFRAWQHRPPSDSIDNIHLQGLTGMASNSGRFRLILGDIASKNGSNDLTEWREWPKKKWQAWPPRVAGPCKHGLQEWQIVAGMAPKSGCQALASMVSKSGTSASKKLCGLNSYTNYWTKHNPPAPCDPLLCTTTCVFKHRMLTVSNGTTRRQPKEKQY